MARARFPTATYFVWPICSLSTQQTPRGGNDRARERPNQNANIISTEIFSRTSSDADTDNRALTVSGVAMSVADELSRRHVRFCHALVLPRSFRRSSELGTRVTESP